MNEVLDARKIEELKRLLSELKADDLRREYSELSDLLQGEFSNIQLNVYDTPAEGIEISEGGFIVSRVLLQGKRKNPTVGIVAPGKYGLNTGAYHETMIVLDGMLSLKNEGRVRDLTRGDGRFVALAGTKLIIETDKPASYLCQYALK